MVTSEVLPTESAIVRYQLLFTLVSVCVALYVTFSRGFGFWNLVLGVVIGVGVMLLAMGGVWLYERKT